MIAAELMRHDPVAKKGVSKDGLKAHFDILSTSATEDFLWDLKFYLKEDFNCLKKEHGAKFSGPLMEWRQTPEGKKIFEAQKATAFAKGGKGSKTSTKQKGEFKGMSKIQIKRFKAAKAKVQAYESPEYRQRVYDIFQTVGKPSTATSSGGSSSSANFSSGDGVDKKFENFDMVLKSLQKDVCKKKKE